MTNSFGPLVSTAWLAAYLDDAQLRLYDTSVFLKPKADGFGYLAESGRAQWQEAHLPGAGFLDVITDLSDASSTLPFMMPAPEDFGATMDALALLQCGQAKVAVCDGSMSEWVRDPALPLELGAAP